jgi:hypothetical protein
LVRVGVPPLGVVESISIGVEDVVLDVKQNFDVPIFTCAVDLSLVDNNE